jgi:hypothetical protein
MIAVALFLYGFAIETPLALIERPMVRKGITWCFAGVIAHAFAMLVPVYGDHVTPSEALHHQDDVAESQH